MMSADAKIAFLLISWLGATGLGFAVAAQVGTLAGLTVVLSWWMGAASVHVLEAKEPSNG